MSRRPRRNAMTLLEVLLAVTLVAVVAGTLFGVVGSSVSVAREQRENMIRSAEYAETLDVLERDLAALIAPAASGRTFLACSADADAPLLKMLLRPGRGRPARLRRVDYFFVPPEAKNAGLLCRRIAPIASEADPSGPSVGIAAAESVPARYEILLTGLRSARLRYLGEEGWQGGWDRSDRLPSLVELTVEFLDGPQPTAATIEPRVSGYLLSVSGDAAP
jgi:type II secretory pathway pseudopilin PulG